MDYRSVTIVTAHKYCKQTSCLWSEKSAIRSVSRRQVMAEDALRCKGAASVTHEEVALHFAGRRQKVKDQDGQKSHESASRGRTLQLC